MKHLLIVACLFISNFCLAASIQKISTKIQMTMAPDDITLLPKRLDILFVIDNSGSMQAHQQLIAKNAEILFKQIENYDLHVGSITTDMDKYSEDLMSNKIKWVSNTAAGWQQQAAGLLSRGVDGSGTESPLAAVTHSISKEMWETNKGFFRTKSNLVIIFITDAEDQSDMTVPTFLSLLNRFASGFGSTLSMHGLLVSSAETETSSCPRDSNGEKPLRLESAISVFGGKILSLCESEKSIEILASSNDFAPTNANPESEVTLNYIPVLSTLTITYGSQILQAGDVSGGWVYYSKENKIVFGPGINWNSEPLGTNLVITFEIKQAQ